ncbi:MAG TPA: hypothetical protein PK883_00210 [Anaerolineaceae bacterium]|nr:hypothetical protein [Anaerolineaceae bacterium]
MDNEPPLFSIMTPVDWMLAALFTIAVVALAQSFFPPFGWLIGLVVALGLLYLAKRRRDRLQRPPDA